MACAPFRPATRENRSQPRRPVWLPAAPGTRGPTRHPRRSRAPARPGWRWSAVARGLPRSGGGATRGPRRARPRRRRTLPSHGDPGPRGPTGAEIRFRVVMAPRVRKVITPSDSSSVAPRGCVTLALGRRRIARRNSANTRPITNTPCSGERGQGWGGSTPARWVSKACGNPGGDVRKRRFFAEPCACHLAYEFLPVAGHGSALGLRGSLRRPDLRVRRAATSSSCSFTVASATVFPSWR